MANETEMIREKMEETRNDLSEKIDKLERQVVDTVQGATDTVAEAVQGARDVVDTVKETMEGAAESVKDTVDAVKGTVEGARESLQGVAESMREAFDLPKQMERHPWLMIGGAVAVGFVAGKLLDYGPEAMQAVASTARTTGQFAESAASAAGAAASAAGAAATAAGSWWTALESMFGPEINKVKELAIGALGAAVRDLAVQSAPEPMGRQVREIIDGFTSRLGGKPFEGSVLPPRPGKEEVPNGPNRRF